MGVAVCWARRASISFDGPSSGCCCWSRRRWMRCSAIAGGSFTDVRGMWWGVVFPIDAAPRPAIGDAVIAMTAMERQRRSVLELRAIVDSVCTALAYRLWNQQGRGFLLHGI